MGLAHSAGRRRGSTKLEPCQPPGQATKSPLESFDFPAKISPGLPDPADLLPKSCQVLPYPAEVLLKLSHNLSKSFQDPPEFSNKGSAVNRSAASIRPTPCKVRAMLSAESKVRMLLKEVRYGPRAFRRASTVSAPGQDTKYPLEFFDFLLKSALDCLIQPTSCQSPAEVLPDPPRSCRNPPEALPESVKILPESSRIFK